MSKPSPALSYVISNDIERLRELPGDAFSVTSADYALPCKACTQLSVAGLSLMHIAAFYDSLDCFVELHRRGCEVSIVAVDSSLPIHYACYNGSFEVVSYILSVDPSQASVVAQNVKKQVFLTALSGDAEILQLLIDNGADIVPDKDMTKDPLYTALSSRNYEFARLLRASRTVFDPDATPLLVTAVQKNAKEFIPYLLECGDDPMASTKDGRTALFLACEKGREWLDIVNLLIRKSGSRSIEPLFTATNNGVPGSIGASRKSAIHWAVQSRCPEILDAICRCDVEVNALDSGNKSCVHYMIDRAEENDQLAMLKILRAKGLDLQTEGRSVLYDFVTAIKKSWKCIDWLLEIGADPYYKVKGVVTLVHMKKIAATKKEMKQILDRHVPHWEGEQ